VPCPKGRQYEAVDGHCIGDKAGGCSSKMSNNFSVIASDAWIEFRVKHLTSELYLTVRVGPRGSLLGMTHSSLIGLGKAYTDALKQWERPEFYAGAGHVVVNIDKALKEKPMRPIELGRKNWMQIGCETAGPKIAAILLFLETGKRLVFNGREYLLEVLPQLSYRATRLDVQEPVPLDKLNPAGWQRARA
jgi:hypothetical protein